jgi:hypothetical protein
MRPSPATSRRPTAHSRKRLDPPEGSIVRSTLRALLEPRRLLPILIVCAPIVLAQRSFSRDPRALPLGALMCATFVLVAPVSWRVLMPNGLEFSHGAIRLVLYATVGAGCVLVVGTVVPKVLGMRATFLTERHSLLISAAMFLVGGWGLGRDIEMEASLSREKARSLELQKEADRSALLALRAHLDPHFLFNTLNAIAEWCREDGETAERAVLELSSILRTLLVGVRAPTWTLREEIELVRTLLALHRLRDPGAFTVEIDVPPALDTARIPSLVLLPLAENAVKHGPASGHRGVIRLAARGEGGRLSIRVSNPGPYAGPRDGSDGLPTLEKRLALAFEGAARLHIEEREGRTTVELDLPLAAESA